MPSPPARQLLEGLAGSAAASFGSFVSALAMILLTLVYVVLMLAERDRFFRFVERLAPKGHAPNARAAMEESADVAYRYLIGRLKVMGIMDAILTTAFLLSGVPYAIFLAIVIVVSAIVPYLGILIGGLLTLLLTEGQTYYFCSEDCKVKFLQDPGRYLSSGQSGHH